MITYTIQQHMGLDYSMLYMCVNLDLKVGVKVSSKGWIFQKFIQEMEKQGRVNG